MGGSIERSFYHMTNNFAVSKGALFSILARTHGFDFHGFDLHATKMTDLTVDVMCNRNQNILP